ncbi:MAG: hypothetical protein KAU35_07435 [candidate division Zixibacteria bacterium]|nr:hypothetical protein [candidate division Zixibacteria bacterium]
MDEVKFLALLGALIAVVGSTVPFLLRLRVIRREGKTEKTYGERLAELTADLNRASSDVDSVLEELAQVARARESSVKRLESELQNLEERESQLKEKVDLLENVPLPVAEHFARLLKSGDKRSARRDYALFVAGVLVTTVLAIVIRTFAG